MFSKSDKRNWTQSNDKHRRACNASNWQLFLKHNISNILKYLEHLWLSEISTMIWIWNIHLGMRNIWHIWKDLKAFHVYLFIASSSTDTTNIRKVKKNIQINIILIILNSPQFLNLRSYFCSVFFKKNPFFP